MPICRIACITKSHSNGGHEHITQAGNPAAGWNWSVEQIVSSIESKTNSFYVQDERTGKRAEVGVVHPQGKRAYIRTYADGVWNDNLLALNACPIGVAV
jgi:hypothetical protein